MPPIETNERRSGAPDAAVRPVEPRPDDAPSPADPAPVPAGEVSIGARVACALFVVAVASVLGVVVAFLVSERSALRRADVDRAALLSERGLKAIEARVREGGGALGPGTLELLRGEVAAIAEARGVMQAVLYLDGGREILAARAASEVATHLPTVDGPGQTLEDDHLLVARALRLGGADTRDSLLVVKSGYPGLEARMRDLVSLSGRAVGLVALLLIFLMPALGRWLTRRHGRALRALRDGRLPEPAEVAGGGAELVELVDRLREERLRAEVSEGERDRVVAAAKAEVRRLRERLDAISAEVDEARRVARSAAAAKAAFVANTSHEVRTPLHAVLGSTSLLLETDLDAEQRALAERGERAAELLLDLVDDVLDLARFDARQIELDRAPFDPGSLVEEVAELAGASAGAKGLEIATFVSPECPPRLMGDERRIRQALMRLVDNAVKFTDAGEVLVELGWEAAEDGVARVRFTVTDTGVGIGEVERARLFRAFEQLDGSDTRRHGGVGLGLALVARIARAAGGEVQLESQAGRGSRFSLLLPLVVPEGDARGIAERITSRQQPLAGLGVLLIGTPGGATRCHVRTLSLLGARVHVESSTYGGFESFVRERIDLVLLDSRLAGRDAFLGALESNETGEPVPVVLMTPPLAGRAPGEACDEAVAAMVPRPLSRSGLLSVVRRALGREAKAGAPVGPAGADPAPGPEDSPLGVAARRAIRILLVEDNPTNQQLVQYVLGKRGYQVEVASNGRHAVDAFTVGSYHAVLMDCQMPEMDGYEATRRIRKLEVARGGRTPILAMTASSMDSDRTRCSEAGMDDLLAKPFHPHEMVQWLEGWLVRTAIDAGGAPRRPRTTRAQAMAALGEGPSPPPDRAAELVARAAEELTSRPVEAPGAPLPAAPAGPATGGGVGVPDLAAVLDDGVLGPLREDEEGRALAAELVESFLDVAPDGLRDMEQAVAEGDLAACARIAHALVSTSGTVGAMRLGRMLRELERLAQGGAREDVGRMVDEARREVELVRLALLQPRTAG